MRRAIALLLLLPSAVALAVPVPVGRLGATLHAGADPHDWMPTERVDAARTGRLRGSLPHAETRVLFDVALEGAHPHGPTIDREGRIFVGTAHGVVGLSSTGEVILDLRLGPIDVAPALLPGGDLLVATRSGELVVLTAGGEVLVRGRASASLRAAPLVLDDGTFVLATVDRRVVRLGTDLVERASWLLDEGPLTTPTLTASGRVAVSGGSTLVLCDLAHGTVTRTFALGARAIGAAVRTDRGDLLQLLGDGRVARIEAEETLQEAIVLQPEEAHGRVFDGNTLALAADGTFRVTIPSGGILAFGEGEAGWARRWAYVTDAPFYGPVHVDQDGYAIATDRRGRLTVVDPTGSEVLRVDLGVPVASPAISGHTLVVATDRPSVMAFEIP